MAHDVFLSWTAKDKAKARQMKKALETKGFRVFWSHTIDPGDDWFETINKKLNNIPCLVALFVDWFETINKKLNNIPCLVALWSSSSVNSTWVRSEAGEAAERGILVPVLIDRVRLPRLFRGVQALDLVKWRGSPRNENFLRLVNRIEEMVEAATAFHEWFTEVPQDDEVTEDDLALVDSTWIVPPSADETYHVHIIVHGHAKTLSRISRVVYFLEGWRNGKTRITMDRSRNFELKEHAWSHFVVKATIELRGQDAIVLRRFIHLRPEGPSLEPFIAAPT